MICPYCNSNDDRVVDSRSSEGGKVVRRRRECLKCERRFTTYERVEHAASLTVIKRDERRESFSREKILSGIHAACGKRKIPEAIKERIADEVEDEVQREYDREVPSDVIGRLVMNKLADIDHVAFIRFASEYYQGVGLEDIMRQLEELNNRPVSLPDQQKLF